MVMTVSIPRKLASVLTLKSSETARFVIARTLGAKDAAADALKKYRGYGKAFAYSSPLEERQATSKAVVQYSTTTKLAT
jgi:hypothetical protein